MKNLSPEIGGRFNAVPAKNILCQTMGGKFIIDHNIYNEIKCNIHNGSSEYFLKPSLLRTSMGDSEESTPKANLPSGKSGEQTLCCNQQSKGASYGTPNNSFKKKLYIYKKTNDDGCKNILDMAVSVFQPVYNEISSKSELCNGQRGNSIQGLSCLNLDVSKVDKCVRRSKSSPSLGEKDNSVIYYNNSLDTTSEHTDHNESPRNNRKTNFSITLTSLLENIPLAYNPLTKQLHYIQSEKHDKKCSVLENNMSNDITDRSRQLESIDEVEASEMHVKVNIVDKQEFYESPRNTLQRVATNTSLCRTDASSFSSISSLSTNTDFSTSASINDELSDIRGIFGEGEETSGTDGQSRTSCDRSRSNSNSSSDFYDEKQAIAQGAKPKRRGLTGFLARSLFSRKTKEQQNALGWKLFCKVPAKDSFSDQNVLPKENKHREEIVASSTTALILENRPANLPAKPVEEEQKHRQQYEQMVEAAKKRELKEAKLRKKQLQQQLKQEEQLSNAIKQWNNEILSNWENMKNARKTRDLWWQGLPSSIRGKVWKQAIGNDLNITPELYGICVNRAKDRIQIGSDSTSTEEQSEEGSSDKEATVELIQLDVSRTFPQLCIFQKGGPYYDMLHSLLGAYVCYRPDVGYVQGMSFLAAVLILNLEVADAFISFANLLNKPCHMAYFRLDEPMMKSYFVTYEEFFEENLPKLYEHFNKQNLSPDLYLTDWIYTLYSKSLPLDVASRVWDVFLRDGEEFLFRTALGILHMYEDILINMDFIHLAQFLTKLPEDITGESLFKSIETIKMLKDKQKFSQVLSSHCEAIGQSSPLTGH